jgi:hypothetical protein
MVFGVEEFHEVYSIEWYYDRECSRIKGVGMDESTNYYDFLNVTTPCFTWGGYSSTNRYVYSPNYASPTLSVYHEEYSLVEMSILRNWWLLNKTWNNEIVFQLNGSITPIYDVSTHGGVFIAQTLNYHYNHNNQSTSPPPTSFIL